MIRRSWVIRGPTRCALILDLNGALQDVLILESGDTHEHVSAIENEASFLASLLGPIASYPSIDAVSGATLTSYAIVRTVAKLRRSELGSLTFQDSIAREEIVPYFGDSDFEIAVQSPFLNVNDSQGNRLGYVTRTAPHGDSFIGYQGPSDTLLVFDPTWRLTHLEIRSSYDNERYVHYFRDDKALDEVLLGQSLEELAGINPRHVEGVSGATMTSQAIAGAIAAKAHMILEAKEAPPTTSTIPWKEILAFGVVGWSVAFAFLDGVGLVARAFGITSSSSPPWDSSVDRCCPFPWSMAG